MIPAHLRHDVKIIFQDVSPKRSGNTAFNAIYERPITDGFEVVLLETVSSYGVKLDKAEGGWANKHDRRTGQLLKGWFTVNAKLAGMNYLRGKGGYFDNINTVRERVAAEAVDNPLRQRVYAQQIVESGDVNDTN